MAVITYTTTLDVKDVTPPTFDSVTRLNDKQLYVAFSEAMSTSGDGSIVDTSKYTVTNKTTGKTLSPVSFNVTGDSKGVILSFNDVLPTTPSDVKVKVQLVKDAAGNYLTNLTKEHDVIAAVSTTVKSVSAVATDKVEVTFTNALQSLNQSDFLVEGHEISYSELSADGKKATLTLKTDLPEDVENAAGALLKLTVAGSPSSVDVLGEKIGTIAAQDITDEISATVKSIASADLSGTKIKITFNEDVKLGASPTTDFKVTDVDGSVAVTGVALDGTDAIVLTLAKVVTSATISAKDVRFVTDASVDENAIENIDPETVELSVDTLAPTVTTKIAAPSTLTASGTHTLVFSEALNTTSLASVKTAVENAYTSTGSGTAVATWAADNKTLNVVITVTATPADDVVLAAIADQIVTDVYGNTSLALDVQN